jgi:hypothetical protein
MDELENDDVLGGADINDDESEEELEDEVDDDLPEEEE